MTRREFFAFVGIPLASSDRPWPVLRTVLESFMRARKETTMRRSDRRGVVSLAALLCCLSGALFAVPTFAGVNRWTAIGPDGANVVAIAVDPGTPSTVYAGTLGSGILTSVDGGTSW